MTVIEVEENYVEVWEAPQSMAEARSRMDDEMTQIQRIQTDLSSWAVFEPSEKHQTKAEWRIWQRKAKLALNYRLAEYRRLKSWLVNAHDQDNRRRIANLITAARAFLNDESDENYSALSSAVNELS